VKRPFLFVMALACACLVAEIGLRLIGYPAMGVAKRYDMGPWGMWHGARVSVYQLWNRVKRNNPDLAKTRKRQWFDSDFIKLTFVFVTIAWWLFI
jgi:hypothetical protein